MYTGLGPHAMHFYNHGTQFARRRDGDTIALRSPILEEFRTNRTRKWELCVGVSFVFFKNSIGSYCTPGYLWTYCGIQR